MLILLAIIVFVILCIWLLPAAIVGVSALIGAIVGAVKGTRKGFQDGKPKAGIWATARANARQAEADRKHKKLMKKGAK